MNTNSLELIEVQMHVYPTGYSLYRWESENLSCGIAIMDGKLVDAEEVELETRSQELTLITFVPIGQSYDSIAAGGIEYEIQAVGLIDTFEPDIADLLRIGQGLLKVQPKPPAVGQPKFVRFLAAFNYWSSYYSGPEGGDCDSGHDLIGHLQITDMEFKLVPLHATVGK